MHLAFAAAHAPHQAPAEYLDRYRGRYDRGWDAVRAERHERQLRTGIIPPGTELPPPNPDGLPWDSLGSDERRLFARMQEAYAAMVAHTDTELGWFVGFLREVGRLDNTLIFVMSDNGASQEGGPRGSLNPTAFQNRIEQDFARNLAQKAFVDRKSPDEQGVLVALGGHAAGYVMYVKDDRLCFEYNYVGERYLLESSETVPPGRSCLEFRFEKTGDRRGTGSLLVQGKTVAEREFPQVVPWFHGWEGLDVGRDALAPVSENYDGELPYSGELEHVLIEVAPTEDEWLFEAVD